MKVLLSKQAQKDLDRIPKPIAHIILNRILQIPENPGNLDIKKLRGLPLESFRLRVGIYRVLFTLESNDFVIKRVLPRGSAY